MARYHIYNERKIKYFNNERKKGFIIKLSAAFGICMQAHNGRVPCQI